MKLTNICTMVVVCGSLFLASLTGCMVDEKPSTPVVESEQDSQQLAKASMSEAPPDGVSVKEVEKTSLGDTKNVSRFGTTYLAGQFGPSDIETIKAAGITTVITLRTDGEIKWDEQQEVEAAGLKFVAIPFRSADSLTDDVFDEVRRELSSGEAKLLHCGSANRVGAVWAAYRALDGGLSTDEAIAEGKKVGLRKPEYEAAAIDYINRAK